MSHLSTASDGTELAELQYDLLLKFILLGDSGVGKSCLLYRYINNRFRDKSMPTIGVEFVSSILRLPSSSAGDKTLKIQLWDLAGQERFRSVGRNYYRAACGAVIMYDITNRASFESLSSWLADVRTLSAPQVEIVVVGNKTDQEEDRVVSYLEASRWAKQNRVLFLEASSFTGENVAQPFILLARSILLGIESGRLNPSEGGTGVSFGERELVMGGRRGSSSSSKGRTFRLGTGSVKVGGGRCC